MERLLGWVSVELLLDILCKTSNKTHENRSLKIERFSSILWIKRLSPGFLWLRFMFLPIIIIIIISICIGNKLSQGFASLLLSRKKINNTVSKVWCSAEQGYIFIIHDISLLNARFGFSRSM